MMPTYSVDGLYVVGNNNRLVIALIFEVFDFSVDWLYDS